MERKRPRIAFPDASLADDDGLLAVSRDLGVEHLLAAYRAGVFPWPADDSMILWFSPPKRAVLDFKDFKVSKRLPAEFKKRGFSLQVNKRFEEVLESCASQPRPGQQGTWITPKILKAYKRLNKEGFALSFETEDAEGRLAGGLYGVLLGRYFSGESMFHRESGASKFALVALVAWLQERGLSWLDAQVMTPLLESFGAKEISREEYLERVKADCEIPGGR